VLLRVGPRLTRFGLLTLRNGIPVIVTAASLPAGSSAVAVLLTIAALVVFLLNSAMLE
jgi:hypothetical protein